MSEQALSVVPIPPAIGSVRLDSTCEGASRGETAPGADLGGSSNYSNSALFP